MKSKPVSDQALDEDPSEEGFSVSTPRGRIWMQARFDGTVKRMDYRGNGTSPSRETAERLIKMRSRAQSEKRFAEVDELEKQLREHGVSFEDRVTGTVWWWRRQ